MSEPENETETAATPESTKLSDEHAFADLLEAERVARERMASVPREAAEAKDAQLPKRLRGRQGGPQPLDLQAFFAGVLPQGVAVPDRAMRHPCATRGCPLDAERRKNPDTGVLYYLATCRGCTDLQFTRATEVKRAKARRENDTRTLIAIEKQITAWRAKGRQYHA